MEDVILHTEGKYRVVAKWDEWPHKPECMGAPSVMVGGDTVTEHWDGSVDTDAIERAAYAFGFLSDKFARWVRIFSEDLINRKVAGVDPEDALTVTVSRVHGYSQGDVYVILEWHDPEHPEYVQGDDHELVNWARGDTWVLATEKRVTWTTDDEDYEDREEWENVDSVGGFFVQWPEKSEWLKDEAKDMIPED